MTWNEIIFLWSFNVEALFQITISILHNTFKSTFYGLIIFFIATPHSFLNSFKRINRTLILQKKVYAPPLLFMKNILEGWCIQWLFLLPPFRQIVLPMHIIFIIVILGWIFLILSWTTSIFDMTEKIKTF